MSPKHYLVCSSGHFSRQTGTMARPPSSPSIVVSQRPDTSHFPMHRDTWPSRLAFSCSFLEYEASANAIQWAVKKTQLLAFEYAITGMSNCENNLSQDEPNFPFLPHCVGLCKMCDINRLLFRLLMPGMKVGRRSCKAQVMISQWNLSYIILDEEQGSDGAYLCPQSVYKSLNDKGSIVFSNPP